MRCNDVPGEIRTHDLQLRRLSLYPAELLGQDSNINFFCLHFKFADPVPSSASLFNEASCVGTKLQRSLFDGADALLSYWDKIVVLNFFAYTSSLRIT